MTGGSCCPPRPSEFIDDRSDCYQLPPPANRECLDSRSCRDRRKRATLVTNDGNAGHTRTVEDTVSAAQSARALPTSCEGERLALTCSTRTGPARRTISSQNGDGEQHRSREGNLCRRYHGASRTLTMAQAVRTYRRSRHGDARPPRRPLVFRGYDEWR